MLSPLVGLHHVTAIASDPQRNLDFYTQVLGLRFVKRTVNFDDPGTYHFYFGDDAGSPGTILTFFPWPHVSPGHSGVGEVTKTAFSVPAESLEFWQERLADEGVAIEDTGNRFEEKVLTFADPDGMKIEIVAHTSAGSLYAPRFASVPPEHAIRGFFGVTLLEHGADQTAAILNVMGFRKIAEDGNRLRFSTDGGALGNHIDLLVDPKSKFGRSGAGTVHHIAFRVKDDAAQLEWRTEIAKHLDVTPVMDRTYFHSIYFREPGGVLFELATDPPGFTLDEPIESLGEELRIPLWLGSKRSLIEQRLPPVTLHKSVPPIELQNEAEATMNRDDPHQQGAVRHFGMPLAKAAGAVILLHGRGGSAEDILTLANDLFLPQLVYLAPEAARNSWYPNSFLAPVADNEPWLTSALRKVETTAQIAVDAGISTDRIVIGGFSQGACLATEFVASHPRRYAGLIAFSGGLIGPPDANLAHEGDLADTPAFFGSSDPDPHVPWKRVEQSAAILAEMGAAVTFRRYPNRPHAISSEEIIMAKRLLQDAYVTTAELNKEEL